MNKFKVGDWVNCSSSWAKEYNPGQVEKIDKNLCRIRFEKFTHYDDSYFRDGHDIVYRDLEPAFKYVNFKTVKEYLEID